MIVQLYRKIFWIILVTSMAIYSFATEVHKPYRFKSITVNENLSHSDVLCLAQDSFGFIWIGTNNGLNKFDGYQITTFKYNLDDPNSLPGNRIRALVVDKSGQIWLDIENLGLYRFRPPEMKFTKVEVLKTTHVLYEEPNELEMILDNRGDVWINQKPFGLCRFLLDEKGEIIKTITYLNEDVSGQSNVGINQLSYGSGKLFCLLSNNTIQLFNEQQNTFQQVITPDHSLGKRENLQLIYAKNQKLWVGSNQSLVRYDLIGDTLENAITYPFNQEIIEDLKNIFEDHLTNLWLGTEKGLYLFSEEDFKKRQKGINNIQRIFEYNNSSLFEDSFGVLWVGNIGEGISYTNLKRKPFAHIFNATLSENLVTSIYKDHLGKVWMGTRTGLTIFEKNRNTDEFEIQSHHLAGEYISFMFRDSKENFWIGSKFGGLFKTIEKDGILEMVPVDQLVKGETQTMNNLMRIAEDNQGRLWVSTFLRGIFIIDLALGKKIQLVHNPRNINSLSSNKLTDVYWDPIDGAMWISTRDRGLNRLIWTKDDNFHFDHYEYDPDNPESISSNHAWQIMRDLGGKLWVATLAGGINQVHLDAETGKCKFIRFTKKDGLVDNDIEAMAEDGDGNLWLSGVGLTKFNPATHEIEHFDYQDGLQSNSFKVGAVFKDDEGILYFGGINGINYFNPLEIVPDSTLPKIYITDFSVYNREIDDPVSYSLVGFSSIKLNARQNDLSISFVGLQYTSPEKNQYQYQLLGYDQGWNNTSYPNLTANYLNTPPGRYTFQVKVSNGDGIWTEQIKSLEIYISSPWYATSWAFLCYAILLASGLYYFRIFTEEQVHLKNELFLAEKEHELDRSKFSFFTKISHELRSPLTLIKGPLEELLVNSKIHKTTRDKLQVMQKSANRLLMLTNQLLDFRKMETGNMRLQVAEGNFVNFAHELFLVFSQSASGKETIFQFNSELENIPLTFDRNKMEIVLINLLSNAIKFTSPKGTIRMNLRRKGNVGLNGVWEDGKLIDNYLIMELYDNGIGMSKGEVEKIFNPYYQGNNVSSFIGTGIGLSLVKGFVELHKGEIDVVSSQRDGTTFTMKIPFGNLHFPEDQIVNTFDTSEYLPLYYSSEQSRDIDFHQDSIGLLEGIKEKNRQYKILIVEDNVDLRGYIQNILQEDFFIETAGNGKEGYEMALEFEPDLILSDIMMPVLDGIGMCEKIKSDVHTAHIPIILLTARTSFVYKVDGLELGAEDYITKPFSVSLLKAKIHSILKNRSLQREFYRKQIFFKTVKKTHLNPEEKLVFEAINLIEAHLDDVHFDVKSLAEGLYQSQSNLYRKIKLVTGKSLVELISEVRLKNAALLLKENDLSVTEIAYKTGFSSVKYFRKCFKKLYQVSPSEFRHSSEIIQ